jgi:hypothetical protein
MSAGQRASLTVAAHAERIKCGVLHVRTIDPRVAFSPHGFFDHLQIFQA